VKNIQLFCPVSDRELDFNTVALPIRHLGCCGLRAEGVTVASRALLLIRTVQHLEQAEVEFYGKFYFYIKAM
jgi:hypothetical protein